MDLLSVIRRWRLRDKIPLREIERRTGLSRNTIRKYLRADTVVPQFKVPDRSSKLDPFAEKLTGWLQIEAGKSRKQKRTAKSRGGFLHPFYPGGIPRPHWCRQPGGPRRSLRFCETSREV